MASGPIEMAIHTLDTMKMTRNLEMVYLYGATAPNIVGSLLTTTVMAMGK